MASPDPAQDTAADPAALKSVKDVGPTPHGEEKSARYKVALIAVLAAVVGALASLTGAFITARTNESVAQQNFVRNQQSSAYSQFLVGCYNLRDEQGDLQLAIWTANLGEYSDDLKAAENSYDAAYNTWKLDAFTISLISSSEVKAIVEDMQQQESILDTYFGKNVATVANPSSGGTGSEVAMGPEAQAARSAVQSLIDQFMKVASEDLTQPPG